MQRSLGLDLLRIFSILGVVAIHSFGSIAGDRGLEGTGSWELATTIDIGFAWVVPVLVAVSGALLLAPRAHADGPGAFYRKRLFRLGWAFVFWQVFYLVVIRIGLSHQSLSPGQIANLAFQGETYTHVYFLWLIVGLYAVAPILFAFIKESPARAPIAAAVIIGITTAVYIGSALLAAIGHLVPLTLNAATQWIPYVGYFLAGWALREVRLHGVALALVTTGTVVALAANVYVYMESPRLPLLAAALPVSYLGPLVVLASLGIFVAVNSFAERIHVSQRTARAIGIVADAVFGVYLVHFALLVLGETLWPQWRGLRTTEWWAAAVTWATVLFVSAALSIGSRRVPYLRRLF
jgi:surface polysaccharide O-acyltransferase-like enzyme